jgi:hypothetical protein
MLEIPMLPTAIVLIMVAVCGVLGGLVLGGRWGTTAGSERSWRRRSRRCSVARIGTGRPATCRPHPCWPGETFSSDRTRRDGDLVVPLASSSWRPIAVSRRLPGRSVTSPTPPAALLAEVACTRRDTGLPTRKRQPVPRVIVTSATRHEPTFALSPWRREGPCFPPRGVVTIIAGCLGGSLTAGTLPPTAPKR